MIGGRGWRWHIHSQETSEAKGDILKFAEAISRRKGHRPDRGSPVRSRDPFRQMATSNGQDVHISRGIRPLLTPFRQLHLAGGGG